jgi:stress-induced morphogen
MTDPALHDIVASIKRALDASALSPIAHCEISGENDSCGAKLDAIIVSAKFEGMPLLQRQKAVHEAVSAFHYLPLPLLFVHYRPFLSLFVTPLQLKAELSRVHAFSMKTWTPPQFAEKNTGSHSSATASQASP